jgi:hypothetical protein
MRSHRARSVPPRAQRRKPRASRYRNSGQHFPKPIAIEHS